MKMFFRACGGIDNDQLEWSIYCKVVRDLRNQKFLIHSKMENFSQSLMMIIRKELRLMMA